MTNNTLLEIQPQLLSHPWYQKWECGELSADSIRFYTKEYYWQVAQFPRYLSRLHSELDDLESRRVVLENLNDEENPKAPHPELWLDFAEAMGVNRQELKNGAPGNAAKELISEFKQLFADGPVSGIGAILAYESQVPEVARFKTKALEKFYLDSASAEKGTRFFRVHQEADVWHTQALNGIVEKFTPEERAQAQAAASKACVALWKFLDAMPN